MMVDHSQDSPEGGNIIIGLTVIGFAFFLCLAVALGVGAFL